MPMPITRKDTTITARDSGGKVIRVHECRDVRRAVALEAKLAGDHAFAARWAQECEPKASVLMYHGLERLGCSPMSGTPAPTTRPKRERH